MKYVIGDIHGQYYKLLDLINLTKKDATEYIFLGDYIDRGEHSKEVIDYLIKLSKKVKCIFLIGNHEDMWFKYLKGDKSWLDMILLYGGIKTVKSYIDKDLTYIAAKTIVIQAKKMENAFKIHKKFFGKLLYYYELDNYICVHAGINPQYKDLVLPSHNQEDLLWIREEFIDSKFFYKGKKIIFGHTSFGKPYVDKYKIGIDTTMKTITAFCVEGEYFINNEGEINE